MTSRVVTDDAMNIEAILHAESLHKGKVYTGPKSSGFKIPMTPCCTYASFLLGRKSFERRSRWLSARKGAWKEPPYNLDHVGFFNEPTVETIVEA